MILEQKTEENIEYLIIESSNLKTASYAFSDESLLLTFKNGGCYQYSPIKLTVYEEFKRADSQGKFFVKNIKNNKEIKCEKIN